MGGRNDGQYWAVGPEGGCLAQAVDRRTGNQARMTGGGAWPGPGSRMVYARAMRKTRMWRVGLQLEPRAGNRRGRQGRCPPKLPRPGGSLLSGQGRCLPGLRDPSPPPPRGPTLYGPGVDGGRRHELRRGHRPWGRVTSGLYHGGGGGGGPGPGVRGSPPRSRARRFHFPGCPGVNIRVSVPSPSAGPPPPSFPAPAGPRPAPHAADSGPMNAPGRGDRQVWSAARGEERQTRKWRAGPAGWAGPGAVVGRVSVTGAKGPAAWGLSLGAGN